MTGIQDQVEAATADPDQFSKDHPLISSSLQRARDEIKGDENLNDPLLMELSKPFSGFAKGLSEYGIGAGRRAQELGQGPADANPDSWDGLFKNSDAIADQLNERLDSAKKKVDQKLLSVDAEREAKHTLEKLRTRSPFSRKTTLEVPPQNLLRQMSPATYCLRPPRAVEPAGLHPRLPHPPWL